MAQRISLFATLATPDAVHELQAAGVVRASMTVVEGAHAGIALAPAPEPPMMTTDMLTAGDLCPPGSVCSDLWDVLDSRLSFGFPLPLIAFCFLTIRHGHRTAWARAVKQVAAQHDGDDHYLAAAHAFGREYNAVVEVMANRADLFHQLLLDVTDIEGVETVSLHRVLPQDTRGFGA